MHAFTRHALVLLTATIYAIRADTVVYDGVQYTYTLPAGVSVNTGTGRDMFKFTDVPRCNLVPSMCNLLTHFCHPVLGICVQRVTTGTATRDLKHVASVYSDEIAVTHAGCDSSHTDKSAADSWVNPLCVRDSNLLACDDEFHYRSTVNGRCEPMTPWCGIGSILVETSSDFMAPTCVDNKDTCKFGTLNVEAGPLPARCASGTPNSPDSRYSFVDAALLKPCTGMTVEAVPVETETRIHTCIDENKYMFMCNTTQFAVFKDNKLTCLDDNKATHYINFASFKFQIYKGSCHHNVDVRLGQASDVSHGVSLCRLVPSDATVTTGTTEEVQINLVSESDVGMTLCPTGTISTGTWCDSSNQLRRITTCTSDEYESRAPTTTSDRGCTPLTVCSSVEYITTAATANSDRVCSLVPKYGLTGCTDIDERLARVIEGSRVATGCMKADSSKMLVMPEAAGVSTATEVERTTCGANELTLNGNITSDNICIPKHTCPNGYEFASVSGHFSKTYGKCIPIPKCDDSMLLSKSTHATLCRNWNLNIHKSTEAGLYTFGSGFTIKSLITKPVTSDADSSFSWQCEEAGGMVVIYNLNERCIERSVSRVFPLMWGTRSDFMPVIHVTSSAAEFNKYFAAKYTTGTVSSELRTCSACRPGEVEVLPCDRGADRVCVLEEIVYNAVHIHETGCPVNSILLQDGLTCQDTSVVPETQHLASCISKHECFVYMDGKRVRLISDEAVAREVAKGTVCPPCAENDPCEQVDDGQTEIIGDEDDDREDRPPTRVYVVSKDDDDDDDDECTVNDTTRIMVYVAGGLWVLTIVAIMLYSFTKTPRFNGQTYIPMNEAHAPTQHVEQRHKTLFGRGLGFFKRDHSEPQPVPQEVPRPQRHVLVHYDN
jgi:hypothetical protein